MFLLHLKDDMYLLMYLLFLTIFVAIFLLVNNNPFGVIGDLQWFLKPLIMIYGLGYLLKNHFSDRINRKLLDVLLIFSLLGALYGLMQFISWNIYATILPLSDIKIIPYLNILIGTDIPVGRVAGIWGHQNFYGLIAMVVSIYGLINKKKLYLFSGISGLIISFSRWPIFLTVIAIMYLSMNKNYKYLRKYSFSLIIIILTSALFYSNNITSVYDNVYKSYSSTPKIYGMIKTVELIGKHPFGVGLGMYGTKYSAGSYIYKELDFKSNIQKILLTATSGIESFYAILLSQTGIIGLLLFMGIFLRHFIGKQSILLKLKFLLILLLPFYYNLYFPSFLVYNLVLLNHNQKHLSIN
ncbi:MAG: hypothetical protein HN601_02520 [Candidatus Marinimicrobia bacterium]|nr:hypothetical protein [Candidatus Neomarinimicrobiota bacterium]